MGNTASGKGFFGKPLSQGLSYISVERPWGRETLGKR